jgi:hypothetical protein
MGVYLSTNNGANWEQINNGLNSSYIFTLALCEDNILVSTSSGVFLSTNNGTIWVQRNDGLGYNWVSALGVTASYIFAGTNGAGVWKRPLSELTDVNKEENNLPHGYFLSQNYPNPFNPSTVISYSLPSATNVKLIVYNTLGQTTKVLENGFKNSGNYSVDFNASELASGIYFYKLEAGQFSQIKKMILLK